MSVFDKEKYNRIPVYIKDYIIKRLEKGVKPYDIIQAILRGYGRKISRQSIYRIKQQYEKHKNIEIPNYYEQLKERKKK